jgi:hypothetical protein
VQLVNRYGEQLWGYVELDQGGMASKKRIRQRLNDMGLRPMPVYHPLHDGWDYFDELAETHDRVCFGNVALADAPQRRRLVATAWERHRRYPDLWVHMLGLTPDDVLAGMPADSADSSTWLAPIRWPVGQREYALMHSLGSLPREFQYALGSDADGDTGATKAIVMAAVGCKVLQINWRNHQAALARHLDLPAYPPPHPGEPALAGDVP